MGGVGSQRQGLESHSAGAITHRIEPNAVILDDERDEIPGSRRDHPYTRRVGVLQRVVDAFSRDLVEVFANRQRHRDRGLVS